MSAADKGFSAREVELMKWLGDAQLIAQRAQENAERAFDPIAKAAHLERFVTIAEICEKMLELKSRDDESAA